MGPDGLADEPVKMIVAKETEYNTSNQETSPVSPNGPLSEDIEGSNKNARNS